MSSVFATGIKAAGREIIGREDVVSRAVKYLYDDTKNVSLVGLPISGKSSIAYEVFRRIENRPGFDGGHVLLLKTNLAEHESFEEYWRHCIKELYGLAAAAGVKHRVLDREYNFFLPSPAPGYTEVMQHAKAFMHCLKQNGLKTLILVDEFDAAVALFRGERYYYEFFREMGSSGEVFVRMLVVSRQQIKRVETNAYGNSTLFAIFEELAVHEFSDSEIEQFYSILEKHAGPVSTEARQKIYQTAGRFPILLSLLGDRIIDESSDDRQADIDAIIAKERNRITQIFEAVFKQLQNDRNAASIIQAVIGPRYTLTRSDIQTLSEAMGYIFHEAEGRWTIISRDFMMYLRNQKLNVPIWPQLSDAQAALVKLVRGKMMQFFNVRQDELDDALISAGLIPNAKMYENFIKRNKELYNVDSDILDVVSLEVLSEIMGQYWKDIFSICFEGKSYEGYWRDSFEKLKYARDPVAHAHNDYLTKRDIEEVNAVCLEITECLSLQNDHKHKPS